MGCASSNPIVQGGKHLIESAKDSVTDAVHKSEHMLHDAGEAAKEGIEEVKEAIGAAVTSAESGIGNVVEKVGNTFSSGQKDATEATAAAISEDIQNKTKEAVNVAETTVTETVSNVVETIPTATAAAVSSELISSDLKDFVMVRSERKLKKEMSLTDEFGEIIAADPATIDDASLRVEDLEDAPTALMMDTIDSNYKDMKRKAEDLMTNNGLQQQQQQDEQLKQLEQSPKRSSPPPEEQHLTKEEPHFLIWYRQLPCRRRRSGRQRPTPSYSRSCDRRPIKPPPPLTVSKTTKRAKRRRSIWCTIVSFADTRQPIRKTRTISPAAAAA